MDTPLATNQIEISLSTHEALTNGDLAFLQQNGISPMAWSPLGGGALMEESAVTILRGLMSRIAKESGVDDAAVAVAWLLAHPSGMVPVIGTKKLDRIDTAAKSADIKLERQDWYALWQAAKGHSVP